MQSARRPRRDVPVWQGAPGLPWIEIDDPKTSWTTWSILSSTAAWYAPQRWSQVNALQRRSIGTSWIRCLMGDPAICSQCWEFVSKELDRQNMSFCDIHASSWIRLLNSMNIMVTKLKNAAMNQQRITCWKVSDRKSKRGDCSRSLSGELGHLRWSEEQAHHGWCSSFPLR